MSPPSMTGRWTGYYHQRGAEFPIAADILQEDGNISGFMYDGQPDRESSLFDVTAEAGMPPGADEQIETKLRELVPDAPPGPVRYVSHLPTQSILRGTREGNTVNLLKSYLGTSYSGYQVGNHFIGERNPDHLVHYEGQLGADGHTLEGRWWIPANPEKGLPLTEGLFHLHRLLEPEAPSARPATASVPEKPARPWWKLWS